MRRIYGVALLGLAACVPTDGPPVEPMPPEATCPAHELQHLLGQPSTSHDFEALGIPVRILPPSSMMTMDHVPARLNVDLDDAGNIIRLWCG